MPLEGGQSNDDEHSQEKRYEILRSRIESYFDVTSFERRLSANGITTSEVWDASRSSFGQIDGTARYTSRSLFIDSQRGPIEDILSNTEGTDIRSLYSPDQFIAGSGKAMTTFAEGCATYGNQQLNYSAYIGNNFGGNLGGTGLTVSDDAISLIDCSVEQIRKRAEACERMQGFQLLYSTAGGMSGVASNLLTELSNLYPKSLKFCMVQHPSSAYCFNSSINIYNDILSIHQLIEEGDIVADVDDQSLIDVCAKRYAPKVPLFGSGFKISKRIKPTIQDANNLFVDSLLGITQNFRLPTS